MKLNINVSIHNHFYIITHIYVCVHNKYYLWIFPNNSKNATKFAVFPK